MQYSLLQWWKLIFLIFFSHILLLSAEKREIILEKLTPCRGGPYEIKIIINSANITKRTQFKVDGEIIVPTTQSKDLQIILKYRRCEMKKVKNCGSNKDFVLPKVCSLVSSGTGSVYGLSLRGFFKPKLECPIQANTYKLSIDVSLNTIIKIPLTNLRYEMKVVLQNAGKKKILGCFGGTYWIKEHNS